MATPTALEQVKAIIEKEYADEVRDQALHDEVLRLLTPFVGKAPSKRIANAIAKAHPTWEVRWNTPYSWSEVQIWGGDTGREGYDNRLSLMIAYDSTPIVDLDKFRDHNAFAGSAAAARNLWRAEVLKDPARLQEMADAVEAYRKAAADLKRLVCYPNPDQYAIEKLAKGEGKR